MVLELRGGAEYQYNIHAIGVKVSGGSMNWQAKAEQILSSFLLQLKHVFLEFDKGIFAILDLTKYLAENFHGK
jgi:hypothetical protein